MDRTRIPKAVREVRERYEKRHGSSRSDDEGWVTIKGTHVLIDENGTAKSGGKLRGMTFSKARTAKKASAKGGSDTVLGKNSKVPSIDEVKQGRAVYGGLPVIFKDMDAEARNVTTQIWVSKKFFEHPPDGQKHILNHEVAHNLSDEMMAKNAGRWKEFTGAFITEKKVPETSPAYKQGMRTFWEGLYGDIGATAASETVTRAVTEYLDDPEKLRSRSRKAFEEVERFMKEWLKKK